MAARSARRRYWCGGNREPGQDVFFIEALDRRLWRPGGPRDWDACWYTGMPDPEVFERLDATRFINHIPGNNALTIKSHLARTLAAHRELVAGRPGVPAMDFAPTTFHMPADYVALQRAAAADPGRRFLLKPANSSRGRGIRLLADPASAPLDDDWIVQDFVLRPHLRDGRKYVLRLYVLITSVEPLVAWLYEEGFQKLASEPYDPDDADNVYGYLTNPDVNATNTRVEHPVVFVGLGRYRAWIREQGHDDAALFRRIEDLVRMTVIAAREHMLRRLWAVRADTRGCYELLGIDCLIDENLKPWIMECNLSPSLEVCAAPEDGGDFEARTKRRLVEDMVALVGLNEPPDIAALGAPLPDRMLRAFDRQMAARGGFRLVCPGPDPAGHLASLAAPRAADIALVRHIHGSVPDVVFMPGDVGELYEDDRVLLYAGRSGRVIRLNEVASLVWLWLAGGEPVTRIADELAAASGDPWATRESVWALVVDWVREGLIRLAGSDPDRAVPRPDAPASHSGDAVMLPLAVGGRAVRLRLACPAAAARFAPLLAPLAADAPEGSGAVPELALLPAGGGYQLALGDRLVTGPRRLDELGLVLWQMLFELAGADGAILMPGRLVPIGDGGAILVASRAEAGFDAAALALAGEGGAHGAVRIDLEGPGAVRPLALPLRIATRAGAVALAPARPPLPGALARDELAALVIPEPGDAPLEPIAAPAAIAMLARELSGRTGRPPAGRLVELMEEWLAERPVLRLGLDDPAAARSALEARFPLPRAA